MRRIIHIARREWVEQSRQPTMLAVIFTLFSLVAGIVLSGLALVQYVAADPLSLSQLPTMVGHTMESQDMVDGMVGLLVLAYNFLILSQFLGIAAVLSGHSVLHDRQCGTLTFLLLAPVRRIELLVGKVIGAIGPAFLMYLVISGVTSAIATTFSVTEPYSAYLPTSPAWWVAFLVGGPIWAVFISTVCTIVSSVSHDVRTAQQGVWFVVFFGTLTCGFLLTNTLPSGVPTQIAVAALGALGAMSAMTVGALIIQRDLGR